MATDFTYNNKTINSSGPIKPSGKNQPLDPRTEVKLYADIESIPSPYIGMIITVLEDETNSNKMTDYKVLSLKADSYGVANSVVDQVQRYVNYLGASSGGGVSQEDINTAVNNYLTEHPVTGGATAEQAAQIQANTAAIGTEELPTTAKTLKGAIAETFQSVSNGKTLIASAITDKGVTTSNEATFQIMADNISKITTSSSDNTTDPYLTDRILIFEDDFDGTSLNLDNWNIEIRDDGCGNNEIQDYVESQISVSNSNLVITATKVNENNWLSGRINSNDKVEFKYGRIEAKIKMEAYQGYWQAFWLLGGNHYESNNKTIEGVSWPECGEIDIFELYGARKFVQSTYHTKTDSNPHAGGSLAVVKSPALDMNKYHIYALEWTENKLQYSVDGVVYGENDISGLILDGKNPFDKAYYILFNFAIGGNLGGTIGNTTPDTSNMYVDWVRIYAPKNSIYPDTLTLTNYEYDTVSMNVNETKRLIFNTTPSNALMPTIKYTSSNTNVAEYHGGVITTKTLGQSTLTAETKNGLSKVLKLVVQDGTSVSGISLDKTTVNGAINDIITITANIIPDTAVNKNVTFTASNENVILTPSGLSCEIKLVASGDSIVTVQTEDGNFEASCQVFISSQSLPAEGMVTRLEANTASINGTTWTDQCGNNNITFYNINDPKTILSNGFLNVGTNNIYLKSEKITGITDAYSAVIAFDYVSGQFPAICLTDTWQKNKTLPFIEGNATLKLNGNAGAYYGHIGVTFDADGNYTIYHHLKAENENRIIKSGSVATNVSSEIDDFIITIGKRGWEDTYYPTKIKGIVLYNRAITQEEMYTILDYFA